MTLRRRAFLAIRLGVAAFALLTSVYCLLAYLPFTYHQVHLGGLLPWLSAFAAWHPYLYWPVFLAAASTLPSLRSDRTRFLSVLFLFAGGIAGFGLLRNPLLAQLGNDRASLYWAVLALLPLLWMAVLDWRAQPGRLAFSSVHAPETGRLFRACLLSAVSLAIFSAALGAIRYAAAPRLPFPSAQLAEGAVAGLCVHIAVFMAVFLLLNFTGALAGLLSKKPAVHVLLHAGVAAALLSLILKSVVFAPLSFSGYAASVTAVAIAASLVAFAVGTTLRIRTGESGEMQSPLLPLLGSLQFLSPASRAGRSCSLAAVSVLGGYALLHAGTFDWGYLIQTLILLSVWLAVFSIYYLRAPASRGDRNNLAVVAAAGLLCLFFAASPGRPERSLDEYSNYDIGFRIARAALTAPANESGTTDDSLYRFLALNTNIPRSAGIKPVDLHFAGELRPGAARKPNIFIFVIDSLRRDYLSPYNPAITFTPGIQAFAQESIVFRNAFTRYSGTGLSEPSIWAGAMLPHQQYPTPFYPMNTLQKLLNAEGYRQFITKDEILNTILAPSPLIAELDQARPTMACRLCNTLGELKTRIRERGTAEEAFFAYTQPQDLHISVIRREGRSPVTPGDYAGFDGAYASRVQRLDRCFSEFIDFLKQAGLYENSIVVLTSDHGDSLGEEGRWGHAYNVTPEVIRVPLIIHLPRAMQELVVDQSAPAFLIDIAPSLYYLLGHRPLKKEPAFLFGHPLFTATREESARLPDSYLIASSYAPVYGLLGNNGHSLYVADGIAYQDQLYEWDDGQVAPGSRQITPETRMLRHRLIREYVGDLGRFYGFTPGDRPGAVLLGGHSRSRALGHIDN